MRLHRVEQVFRLSFRLVSTNIRPVNLLFPFLPTLKFRFLRIRVQKPPIRAILKIFRVSAPTAPTASTAPRTSQMPKLARRFEGIPVFGVYEAAESLSLGLCREKKKLVLKCACHARRRKRWSTIAPRAYQRYPLMRIAARKQERNSHGQARCNFANAA